MDVKCWGNPIIRVDLTSSAITKEIVKEKLLKKFLTGRGIGDWLLYTNVEPGKTGPLNPDNAIVFNAGLFTGTSFPGAIRNTAVSLNVLTNGYGESSSGGYFALNLKNAGYDGIIISGKSPGPVYLYIDDDHIEIRDASHLTGKDTFESSKIIKNEINKEGLSTCTIGPAGEKLVRYAVMNCDNRYNGRCGMGTIMGSKGLKAIAVRGTGSVVLSNPQKFNEIANRIRGIIKNNPGRKNITERGMGAETEAYNELGLLFVKNFQEVGFNRVSDIGYNEVKKYYKNIIHCPTNCPVDCDRLVRIDEGEPYSGTEVSALQATPAYNMAHFLIDDMPTVIKAFELCNRYGIDMHSWSTVMQWAIECFERGIITREDTDKLELRWGDGPLLLESIRRIGNREGSFGDLLAEGVARASKKIGRGSGEYAMQMKGMEIDDELRVDKGMSFGILTDPRGTSHTLGAFFGGFDRSMSPALAKELFGTENAARPGIYDDKADLVVQTERYSAIQDSLGVCWFATHRAAPQMISEYNMGTYAELITAATGWSVSEEELIEIAERILTVEKSINVLAGLQRKDEYPPDRFFDPIPDGPSEGMSLDREALNDLFKKHSKLHGWDPETGVPCRSTLENLDLKEIADKLETSGKY